MLAVAISKQDFSARYYNVVSLLWYCSGRASREKSGHHQLENLPSCSFKYVYILLCSQFCLFKVHSSQSIHLISSLYLFMLKPSKDRGTRFPSIASNYLYLGLSYINNNCFVTIHLSLPVSQSCPHTLLAPAGYA